MTLFLLLLPPILSLLALAAHFFRTGRLGAVVVVLVVTGLLAVRRRWVPWLASAILVIGTLAWIATLVRLRANRGAQGLPSTRMTIILACVAAATLLSALVFRSEQLKARYGSGGNAPAAD